MMAFAHWAANDLKPYRTETPQLNRDPELAEKLETEITDDAGPAETMAHARLHTPRRPLWAWLGLE